uniref:Uncharacterized protein n=1 Tax=Arundo donax TaxID=35708 RepID=A0A0A8ZDZ7_ARUDO
MGEDARSWRHDNLVAADRPEICAAAQPSACHGGCIHAVCHRSAHSGI